MKTRSSTTIYVYKKEALVISLFSNLCRGASGRKTIFTSGKKVKNGMHMCIKTYTNLIKSLTYKQSRQYSSHLKIRFIISHEAESCSLCVGDCHSATTVMLLQEFLTCSCCHQGVSMLETALGELLNLLQKAHFYMMVSRPAIFLSRKRP